MSINTKSPLKKGQNNFFATKAPNNPHPNNKTIKTPNNNSKITPQITNPKTNSTSQLKNISNQITPNQSPSNPITNENQLSFANAAAKTQNPKKEQAIIIEITDDIQQHEYVYAIAEITKPENIIFMSRISKDRFCIFLSSIEQVDRVVNHPTPITIKEKPIKIRKYFNPDKRIIISNVCPTIPNETILSELNNIGITPTSKIIHLRAGVKKEGFAHILSFRRQMFLSTETTTNLPNSLLINHEGSNHRIFFSDDSLTCFKCKKIGHTSASCNEFTETTTINQNNLEKISDALTSQQQHTITTPQTSMSQIEHPIVNPIKNTEANTTDIMETDLISFTDNKRPAPSSPTTSRNSEEAIIIDNEQNTIATKIHKDLTLKKAKIIRPNTQATIELDTILEPAKQIFTNNASNLSISFTQFKAIIENAPTCSDKQELCDNYNIEPIRLISIIELVYPAISSKAIKNRLTRLSNALLELDIPTYEDNN